ncbi:unnamed protein product [Parajaminaea phylloscopi]
MAAFTLQIHKRGSPTPRAAERATSSPWPLQLEFQGTPTVREVKQAIKAKIPKLYPERQRLTTDDKKPLVADADKISVPSGSSLYIKDLGPQVAWRTVFLVEYFGPLFIHPLLYWGSQKLYGAYEPSQMQEIALGLVILHYLKREAETLFVHRFSSATMPLFNIFKNSAHYWILSGVFLAGAVYRPALGAKALSGTIQENPAFLTACAVVWTLAQLGNFQSHMILRGLRSAGGRERKIPRGGAFELVSCPNYFFETVAWVAFTALTLSPASALFAAVSVGQMVLWAIKKHRNYKKEFGKDYPRRKVMFPFVF